MVNCQITVGINIGDGGRFFGGGGGWGWEGAITANTYANDTFNVYLRVGEVWGHLF